MTKFDRRTFFVVGASIMTAVALNRLRGVSSSRGRPRTARAQLASFQIPTAVPFAVGAAVYPEETPTPPPTRTPPPAPTSEPTRTPPPVPTAVPAFKLGLPAIFKD